MVLPEACADQALAGFDQHIIMEDVELSAAPELAVLSVQGPLAADVLKRAALSGYGAARLGEVGIDVWVPAGERAQVEARVAAALAELGGEWLDEPAWQALHVALAVPQAGVDFNADAYPQEAGLKARAVAFNKGCYMGQEVVYMLENRGQLARRLVQLRGPAAGVSAGAALTDADGKRVGQITSWVASGPEQGLGLGFAKKPTWDVGQELRAGDTVLQITHVVGAGSVVCPVVAS
jgi:tRNA-modifying protein YgfZ